MDSVSFLLAFPVDSNLLQDNVTFHIDSMSIIDEIVVPIYSTHLDKAMSAEESAFLH